MSISNSIDAGKNAIKSMILPVATSKKLKY